MFCCSHQGSWGKQTVIRCLSLALKESSSNIWKYFPLPARGSFICFNRLSPSLWKIKRGAGTLMFEWEFVQGHISIDYPRPLWGANQPASSGFSTRQKFLVCASATNQLNWGEKWAWKTNAVERKKKIYLYIYIAVFGTNVAVTSFCLGLFPLICLSYQCFDGSRKHLLPHTVSRCANSSSCRADRSSVCSWCCSVGAVMKSATLLVIHFKWQFLLCKK